jgi:hypothetical protein
MLTVSPSVSRRLRSPRLARTVLALLSLAGSGCRGREDLSLAAAPAEPLGVLLVTPEHATITFSPPAPGPWRWHAREHFEGTEYAWEVSWALPDTVHRYVPDRAGFGWYLDLLDARRARPRSGDLSALLRAGYAARVHHGSCGSANCFYTERDSAVRVRTRLGTVSLVLARSPLLSDLQRRRPDSAHLAFAWTGPEGLERAGRVVLVRYLTP